MLGFQRDEPHSSWADPYLESSISKPTGTGTVTVGIAQPTNYVVKPNQVVTYVNT